MEVDQALAGSGEMTLCSPKEIHHHLTAMSFGKPFQAQPVKLGPYWREEERQKRRKARNRLLRMSILTTFAVFSAGMLITNWKMVRPMLPTYYPSCSWARSYGAAPIQRGSPGYRAKLDADADGVACEAVPEFTDN